MEGTFLPINDGQTNAPFEFAMDRGQYSYFWIVVLASILAFLSAIAMGSNDISSTFATTVGSRSVTIRQALLLSAVAQILGSYFLGARVVKTVGRSVADLNAFQYRPDLLMFGMMVVLVMTSVSVLLATYKGFPISTTQCIISTIVGFALASPGSAVNWPSVFMIIAGWVVAPFISAFVSAFTFVFIRKFILRTEHALTRTLLLLPLLTWFTIALNIFFVLFVSPLASRLNFSVGTGIGVSLAVGSPFGFILFILRKKIEAAVLARKESKAQENASNDHSVEPPKDNGGIILGTTNPLHLREAIRDDATIDIEAGMAEAEIAEEDKEKFKTSKALVLAFARVNRVLRNADGKVKFAILHKEIKNILEKGTSSETEDTQDHPTSATTRVARRLSVDIGGLLSFEKQQKYFDETERKNPQLHQRAEQFDATAEDAFRYLQVFTSIVASFAQGANSIGNITGPLSVIVGIFNQGQAIKGEMTVEEWVTWLGISGLLVGLFAFGYIVLTSVGVKMIHVSPCRGFAIGFSASLMLAIGSFIGLPLSTTHCCVGAITGVGLVEKPYLEGEDLNRKLGIIESLKKAPVNWSFITKVFITWFFTVAVGISAGSGIYSFATFAPSQIVPMNAQNCLVYYGGAGINTTASTITVATPSNAFVKGLMGFTNNTVIPLVAQ